MRQPTVLLLSEKNSRSRLLAAADFGRDVSSGCDHSKRNEIVRVAVALITWDETAAAFNPRRAQIFSRVPA